MDLLAVQHFIPQDAVLLSAQHLEEEQPATRAEAQTIRARSLSDFMVCCSLFYSAAPLIWSKTNRSLEGVRTWKV